MTNVNNIIKCNLLSMLITQSGSNFSEASDMVDDSIEGELKHIKSFFSSSKDVYKLENAVLLTKAVHKKTGEISWQRKFDLKLYSVVLVKGEKETFYLHPLATNKDLELDKVELKCKNAEDRARWVIAIHKSQKISELDSN